MKPATPGERLLELLLINNRMMHASNALRDVGMIAEADRLAELALGVWTVMASVNRKDVAAQAEVTS
jgi:hypothetical protein